MYILGFIYLFLLHGFDFVTWLQNQEGCLSHS